jgi:hypothetical protein
VATELFTITIWSHKDPAPYKSLCLTSHTHPRFRPSLSVVVLSLSSLYFSWFFAWCSAWCFLSQSTVYWTPDAYKRPDPATNGCRILVSKRVPHPEEACLQRHLLRLAFLLLRIWLVHTGAWMSIISTLQNSQENSTPMLGLPVSTPSSGRSGLLVVPVSFSLSMEA